MKFTKILCNTVFFSVIFIFLQAFTPTECLLIAENTSQSHSQNVQMTLENLRQFDGQSYGQVNEDIFLEVIFPKNLLPQSAIPSIKVVIIQSPTNSKLDVLVGTPKTKLRFDSVGEYIFEVKTGYVLKST